MSPLVWAGPSQYVCTCCVGSKIDQPLRERQEAAARRHLRIGRVFRIGGGEEEAGDRRGGVLAADDLCSGGREDARAADVIGMSVRQDERADRLLRRLGDLFENRPGDRRRCPRVHDDDTVARKEPADVGARLRLSAPHALCDLLDLDHRLRRGGRSREGRQESGGKNEQETTLHGKSSSPARSRTARANASKRLRDGGSSARFSGCH